MKDVKGSKVTFIKAPPPMEPTYKNKSSTEFISPISPDVANVTSIGKELSVELILKTMGTLLADNNDAPISPDAIMLMLPDLLEYLTNNVDLSGVCGKLGISPTTGDMLTELLGSFTSLVFTKIVPYAVAHKVTYYIDQNTRLILVLERK